MSLTNGKVSASLFVTATAAAIVVAVLLVLVGRMGYAKDDFVPLPPNYGSPGVTGNSIGSPTAPVTIVVYSDPLCASCQLFALTTEPELKKTYVEAGLVRLVYKSMIVYGNESILTAEAAEYAAEQNRFWPFHAVLMQAQLSPEDVSIERLEALAEEAGLDTTDFAASLESGKYEEKVFADDTEARELGVKGPPTFFINRMKGTGYKPFEAFQKVINEIIERPDG